jgi:hypothetical protein
MHDILIDGANINALIEMIRQNSSLKILELVNILKERPKTLLPLHEIFIAIPKTIEKITIRDRFIRTSPSLCEAAS